MPRMFSERDLARRSSGCAARSTRRALQPRQGDSRRRGSAARCPGRTASTRSRGSALPSVSSLEEASALSRPRTPRDAGCGSATTSRRTGSTGSSSTSPATSRAPSRPASGSPTLRAALAASGQRLSLDPPGDPTIGALLARNVSGPLRHRFGAPRDLVLGVTLVLADGTIASAGGKVVKNVAGYDLARLVCGSRGRLAFIARVELPAAPAAEGGADARRRDRTTPRRSSRASSARSSSRARSTSSIPAASPCSSRARSAPSRRSSRPRARSSAATRADAAVWDESREPPGRGARTRRASRRATRSRARQRSTRPSSGPRPASRTPRTRAQVTQCHKGRSDPAELCRADPA